MFSVQKRRKNRLFSGPGGPAAFLILLAASPAAGEPGGIVVLRDVPTRNAIVPGAGEALVVRTAPPQSAFAQSDGVIQILDDAATGAISAEAVAAGGMAARISRDAAHFAGESAGASGAGVANALGGDSLSSSIGASVGTATSALSGALSSMKSATTGGR